MDEKTKKVQSKAISSSLRFPRYNLEFCLGKIKLLFTKNSKNFMSSEAMPVDMGFTGNNGASDSILASLKYYGLLERTDNSRYKIADFIIDYCISNTLDKECIRRSLLSVPINKKLFSSYDIDSLPSENEIKSFLIKDCGYSLKDTTTYIETFNKDILLYKTHIIDTNINNEKKIEDTNINKENNNFMIITPQVEMRTYNHPLSNGKYISIQLPANIQDLDKQDLEDSSDLLTLVLNKISKQIDLK